MNRPPSVALFRIRQMHPSGLSTPLKQQVNPIAAELGFADHFQPAAPGKGCFNGKTHALIEVVGGSPHGPAITVKMGTLP
jgi:hypothetical protein